MSWGSGHYALGTNLHLGPLAPDLGELVHGLEVDFRRLQQDLTSAVEVLLGLASGPTLFVELREVNIQSVEVGGSSARIDGGESGVVRLCNLRMYLRVKPLDEKSGRRSTHLLVIVSP